jgi:hypothetical protein
LTFVVRRFRDLQSIVGAVIAGGIHVTIQRGADAFAPDRESLPAPRGVHTRATRTKCEAVVFVTRGVAAAGRDRAAQPVLQLTAAGTAADANAYEPVRQLYFSGTARASGHGGRNGIARRAGPLQLMAAKRARTRARAL